MDKKSKSNSKNTGASKLKHPIHYTIFKPNKLIGADRSELQGLELAVYNLILNNNHKETPDLRVYKIMYKDAFPENSTNLARDRKRIGDSLQKRSIYLDEKFVKDYFGEKYAMSLVPFPKVVYHKDHYEIHLEKTFKKVLTMLNLGFTKGDIDTLMMFKHDVSHTFYWVARQRQSFRSTWVISVKEFRELLHLKNKYKDWMNFRRRILEAIQEDMAGTWVEFEVQFIKKGKGGAVRELIFYFKNGPKEEKDQPIGTVYRWEEMLQRMKINDLTIKQIRGFVKAQTEMEIPSSNEKIIWDSQYIMYSAEKAREILNKKKANPKAKPVDNLAAWFLAGLMNGTWIEYVKAKKQEYIEENQAQLFS